MPRYFVSWEIDIDANSPRAAAEQAFAHINRPGTTANVFKVITCDGTGEEITIDLEETEDG